MVRVARERIDDLFALAEREAKGGGRRLADRYVALARKIGMRYNVRLLPEYRELYCRRCSAYWVEGRTVRTRLRAGRRVRTCLACGRERRTMLRETAARPSSGDWGTPAPELRDEEALTGVIPTPEEEPSDAESEEE